MKGKYVVYVTLYSGTKMPKWYIGSTNISRINKGYNGSVGSKDYKEIYIKEQEENKHLFKTRVLSYHENRKSALEEELRLQEKHKVIKNRKYINMSYAKINGWWGRDVRGENHQCYGRKFEMTQEHKDNISRAKKGFKHSEIGKNNMKEAKRIKPCEFTQETRNKISKALGGVKKSEEHRKNMSLSRRKSGHSIVKGKKLYNNGIVQKFFASGDIIEEGFVIGGLPKPKTKKD